jgi:PRC-barrel domain
MAPIATMIAAMMTAANLGARLTGWGFVVFTIGSIGWSIVGFSTGQTNLVATNGFLTLVNCVGVWRWLGRQRAYEDGGKSAKAASRHSSTPTLFAATGFAGMPVLDNAGQSVGRTVESLIACDTGRVSYVVVATGGLGGIDETLRAVALDDLRLESDGVRLLMPGSEFMGLEPLKEGDWPSAVAPRREVAA